MSGLNQSQTDFDDVTHGQTSLPAENSGNWCPTEDAPAGLMQFISFAAGDDQYRLDIIGGVRDRKLVGRHTPGGRVLDIVSVDVATIQPVPLQREATCHVPGRLRHRRNLMIAFIELSKLVALPSDEGAAPA